MILTYSHCKIQLIPLKFGLKNSLIIHILLIFEGRCAIIFFVPIIKRQLSWNKQYYFEDIKVVSKKVVPFIVFWSRSFCYSHGNHFRISPILTSLLEYVQLLTTSRTVLSPQSQLFHFHWGFFGFKHCIIHNSNTGKCTHPCCTSKRILP